MDKAPDETPESLRQRIADLEKYNRTLRRELTRRVESLPELLPRFYRPDEIPVFDGRDEETVDLILPVWNAFDLLGPCLDSIFANTDVPFRLFVNDDASTDPRVSELLAAVQDRHPDRVNLFLQKENRGFCDSVNFLLAKTNHDVILVNSDTLLPPGWASRLLWPIRNSGEKVASCTPFANGGPMIGFPDTDEESGLFGGLDVRRLDAVFQMVKPEQMLTMPTGVGFCLAMSRRALNEIGYLDAETFRPAYGEEYDWCLRAARRGYRNVLAPNLFVYHKIGGSYQPSPERAALRQTHYEILMQRYPAFENDSHTFNDNPAWHALHGFLLLLLASAAGGGVRVLFTAAEPEAAAGIEADPDTPLLLVSQHPGTGEYFLFFRWKKYARRFTSPNLNWVVKAFYRLELSGIGVEGLSPAADRGKTARALGRLAEFKNIPAPMDWRLA